MTLTFPGVIVDAFTRPSISNASKCERVVILQKKVAVNWPIVLYQSINSVVNWTIYGKAYLKKRPELLEKDSGEN